MFKYYFTIILLLLFAVNSFAADYDVTNDDRVCYSSNSGSTETCWNNNAYWEKVMGCD